MAPRRGLSLTEVLIAIFVMAIGMISLLALFPLGMINMAYALKNNRMSQAVANANAGADLPSVYTSSSRFNLRADIWYRTELQGSAVQGTPYPDLGVWNNGNWQWKFLAGSPSTSFVVYVDPIGESALGAPVSPGNYVGGYRPFTVNGLGVQVGVPRVSTTQTAGNPIAARNFCSQDDDVTFNTDGSATYDPAINPAVVERSRRYSWGYVCRWPRFADSSVVDMSVPVYSGRGAPIALAVSGGATAISTEPAYRGGGGFAPPNPKPTWWDQLAFLQGTTTCTVMAPASGSGAPFPLPIRRGDWVFDNTLIIPPPDGNGNPQPIPAANGFFYKVVGISEPYTNSLGNVVQDLQLDRPAKASGFAVVLMKAVGDVREKSDGRMPVK